MEGFVHPTFERSYGSGVDDDSNNQRMSGEVGSTSSLSEYLMVTLPGWRVDDFLVESNYHNTFCSSNNGYCKVCGALSINYHFHLLLCYTKIHQLKP